MANNVDPSKIETLKRAMSRASKLMELTANGTVDKIAAQKRDSINESITTNATMMPPLSSTAQMSPKANHSLSEQKIRQSKIPAVIQESFLKTAKNDDLSFLSPSVLDEIQPDINKKPAIVKETAQPKAHQQEAKTSSSNSIDYPTIRSIVEDVVRKYTSSLKNKILNESVASHSAINGIVLGKTFKFVSSNGDLYEAKLTKIGNIHKKNKQQ